MYIYERNPIVLRQDTNIRGWGAFVNFIISCFLRVFYDIPTFLEKECTWNFLTFVFSSGGLTSG